MDVEWFSMSAWQACWHTHTRTHSPIQREFLRQPDKAPFHPPRYSIRLGRLCTFFVRSVRYDFSFHFSVFFLETRTHFGKCWRFSSVRFSARKKCVCAWVWACARGVVWVTFSLKGEKCTAPVPPPHPSLTPQPPRRSQNWPNTHTQGASMESCDVMTPQFFCRRTRT